MFWNDDETVIQYHPKKSEYVNECETCLHLWRKCGQDFETPPKIFVWKGAGKMINVLFLVASYLLGFLTAALLTMTRGDDSWNTISICPKSKRKWNQRGLKVFLSFAVNVTWAAVLSSRIRAGIKINLLSVCINFMLFQKHLVAEWKIFFWLMMTEYYVTKNSQKWWELLSKVNTLFWTIWYNKDR